MLFIKTIQLSKKKFIQNRIVLLFDTTTTSPCLYPLLYSLTALRFQSFATQQSDMLAIKLWYEFWFLKYSTLFCESFFSSGYTPEVYMHEIDNFIVFLENNKKLEMNLIRLRSNTNVNYKTITQRLRSVIKFFVFLLDEYWNIRNQDLTIKEITSHRKKIDRFLLNKKKIFGKFSQRSLTIKNTINHSFKSLSNEMVANLYEVIRPDQKNKTNPNNPFSTQPHQLRNFLIIHLMLNYGLRVGELMLLTEKSIKKSINSDSYSLIVTNTDDENDTRMRKPSIKNEQSYRVIKLNQKDYNFLVMYINYIRSCGESDILFTSLKPPYSPLSYSAINIIFNKIDKVFRYLHPIYFDNNKVDSIHKITPHVCRHTWAYITLAFAIKKYQAKGLIDNDENMQQAQENLRVLGGWSVNSVMPSYYAKRFIVDSANLLNLKRISEELLEL